MLNLNSVVYFQVASPDISSGKTVAPLNEASPPEFIMAPNLRHAPAFWDLNEAGDAASAFGTLKPAESIHLYEEPFASTGGKFTKLLTPSSIMRF